ncbi:nucleotidyltransferase domain-containing protein [Salicibibacter halophilus]|uniref:Nucleotidyltransferase domain-containing protein n=1 Tax=Salicibibacter halophilus TaxID=2502791 RepID=A0A514LK65_9BACI|nr:nucleotidyltransferase domain-containing protein [Salicibibacter halophilus]QDI92250.1 nucleotidyltransferase domain-containing protein [Salicibibacter halophilus]
MAEVHHREAILSKISNILRENLGDKQVTVYLFGSWAKGNIHTSSDIDIAIDHKNLPNGFLYRIRAAFEESTIPYQIDAIDLPNVDENFRNKVFREGIQWDVCKSESPLRTKH